MHQVGRATHQVTFLSAKLQVRYAPGARYALGEARYALGVLPRTLPEHIQILLSSIKIEVGFCPWLMLSFQRLCKEIML